MNDNNLLQIIKKLNDNRSKLSALYSLYNSSILAAEINRTELGNYYEQLIDYKNDLNAISNTIFQASKKDRVDIYTRQKSKIKKLNVDIKSVHTDFVDTCNKYKLALKDCGSLKTEYKHEVSELCKEFKSSITDETDPLIIKGYKQQVRVIKAILEKIELMVSDYNVKRNKVENDNVRFVELFDTVNVLLNQLENIA